MLCEAPGCSGEACAWRLGAPDSGFQVSSVGALPAIGSSGLLMAVQASLYLEHFMCRDSVFLIRPRL